MFLQQNQTEKQWKWWRRWKEKQSEGEGLRAGQTGIGPIERGGVFDWNQWQSGWRWREEHGGAESNLQMLRVWVEMTSPFRICLVFLNRAMSLSASWHWSTADAEACIATCCSMIWHEWFMTVVFSRSVFEFSIHKWFFSPLHAKNAVITTRRGSRPARGNKIIKLDS